MDPTIAFGSQQQFESTRFLSVGHELAAIDSVSAQVSIYQVSWGVAPAVSLATTKGATSASVPLQNVSALPNAAAQALGTRHVAQFTGEKQADNTVLQSISAKSTCAFFSFEELRYHDVGEQPSAPAVPVVALSPIPPSTCHGPVCVCDVCVFI